MTEKEAKAQELHIIDGPKIDESPNHHKAIWLAYRKHIRISHIARGFNVSRMTVYRIIRHFSQ